jgi:hypothetical protein
MSEALNEIHAYFGKLNTTTTKKVSQWAYGQKLIIHDPELPPVFEAYYSNSRSRGTADPQIGTDGVVDAPHAYFRSGADIYVFLMVHEGQDDGRYNKIVHIPIDPCSEPSDVEPEPYEQSVIDQAIAVLNTAVTQTGQDVISADASAQAAAQSATEAQTAAQSAQASATSASGSASTASTAAATATTKASDAATSAANAASAKTAAETAETNAKAAQTASESARASAESAAQTATTKASEASTSAASASGSASAASASASQASESATSAADSATAASGSATSAATSASTASTKASEASASAIAAQTAQTAAEAAQTAAETAQTEAEAARDETVTEAASIRGLLKDKADIIISNADGAIATFNDGGNNMPMVSCVAKIEPVQSGSGDPSPENVRPISGWTGCNVVVSPTENAQDGTTYPISWQSEAGTVYGGTVDLVSGVLTVDCVLKQFDGTENFGAISDLGTCKRLRWTLPSASADTRLAKAFSHGACLDSYTSDTPHVYMTASFCYLYLPVSESTADAARQYLADQVTAGTPVQVVYQVASGTTYQLTPVEVKTLLGLNNIWADTGDVEVQYRADTKLYIENHQPNIPVEDVQINGTSIVTDGVANVPLATDGRYGAVMLGSGFSSANGVINVDTATAQNAQDGASQRKVLTPYQQHRSTFYGLTKAAGVDMASSSNPVGTYTDEAKIAIQKMLGIYEAPFRLIRTVTTVEGQTEVYISTDENGEPFELTEAIVDIQMVRPADNVNGFLIINEQSKPSTLSLLYSTIPNLLCGNLFNNSSARRNVEHLEIIGGRFFGQSTDGVMSSYNQKASLNTNAAAAGILELDKIRTLLLCTVNDNVFGTGTIVTVYGR